jgi:hypothetical protein
MNRYAQLVWISFGSSSQLAGYLLRLSAIEPEQLNIGESKWL